MNYACDRSKHAWPMREANKHACLLSFDRFTFSVCFSMFEINYVLVFLAVFDQLRTGCVQRVGETPYHFVSLLFFIDFHIEATRLPFH